MMVADGVGDGDGEDFVQGADTARKGYEDVAQGKAMAEKLLAEQNQNLFIMNERFQTKVFVLSERFLIKVFIQNERFFGFSLAAFRYFAYFCPRIIK